MAPCALFILGPLWMPALSGACCGEELSREAVLSWFRERLLEGLGLEEPPPARPHGGAGAPRAPRRAPRRSTEHDHDTSQIILFPSSDSPCAGSGEPGPTNDSHSTYYFQPSVNPHEALLTSAHFWFYAGEGGSSSAELFVVRRRLLPAAASPPEGSADGWSTFRLDRSLLPSLAEGPFLLQVRCPACRCLHGRPERTPFLHLRAGPRGPLRPRRHAPLPAPRRPSAVHLLQRPSQGGGQQGDCRRAEVRISFEELGWDNWIVHPKTLAFRYCHGNCSAGDRPAAALGMTQCCAPVPGTMKSLRITTTSDGGHSFKYETLPNILPEECTCV